MSSLPSDAGALVIRIWREPGVPGFRGRVLSTSATSEPGEWEVTVRDEEQLHAAVQEWLDRFLGVSLNHSSC
jgi:hypothetical protein